jgi:hypothetical protein
MSLMIWMSPKTSTNQMKPVQFNSHQHRSLIEVIFSGLQAGTTLAALTHAFTFE